jgi:hypothetical protein
MDRDTTDNIMNNKAIYWNPTDISTAGG